jgi:hypothetical protein
MKYIKTFESFNDNLLKELGNELAETMHCDRFGACVHFAEEFVLKVNEVNTDLLSTFFVIEGYVNWSNGDGKPQQHTWIELESGEKIDPTYIQFTKYGRASYRTQIKSKFTGLEYYNETIEGTWFSERRKKYPEMVFK